MAQTEDIAEHTKDSGTRTTSSLGDSIERAMADADKRLTRLVERLHTAARGSSAFEGAEHDAKRVLEWFQAKAHELEGELEKAASDASQKAHGAARALTGRTHEQAASLERDARAGDDRPPADTPGG